MPRALIIASIVVFLSACTGSVKMHETSSDYKYAGQKYGIIKTLPSPDIMHNKKMLAEIDQLNITGGIIASLIQKDMYDKNSTNTIEVQIYDIHIRNEFLAIAFGFLAGTDTLDATVSLTNNLNDKNINFDISASNTGFFEGTLYRRSERLNRKFAQLTTDIIINGPSQLTAVD